MTNDKPLIAGGKYKSDLTVQEVYDKMQSQFYAGLKCGRQENQASFKKILERIDECADKTDIWDNERWDKFRKLLRKEIKASLGEEKK